MNERDLEAADTLYRQIGYYQNSIAIAKQAAPDLLLLYEASPYADDDGVVRDKIDVHGVLGVERDELRLAVTETIQKYLTEKVQKCRASLQKLGVKLEQETPAPVLKARKKPKARKKLAAPKKTLQLVAPESSKIN